VDSLHLKIRVSKNASGCKDDSDHVKRATWPDGTNAASLGAAFVPRGAFLRMHSPLKVQVNELHESIL
jgi:hypothetical protein